MSAKAKQKKVRIYTRAYSPFTMGGDVNRPIAAEVEPIQTFALYGHTLHLFQNPLTKHYHIAEDETGGLVGYGKSDVEAITNVTRDLASADPEIVKQQIEAARKEAARAKLLEPDEFWRGFN